jgi:hypothetical protein
MQAVVAVTLFIELHGASRFTEIGQNPFETPSFGEPIGPTRVPSQAAKVGEKRKEKSGPTFFQIKFGESKFAKGFFYRNVWRSPVVP